MAVRCYAKCRYNIANWCMNDYIEIDEDGKCRDLEPIDS